MTTLAETLAGMGIWERAALLVDVEESGDEEAQQRLDAALDELGVEGTLARVDALAVARKRRADR